jgi:hypothetical protein
MTMGPGGQKTEGTPARVARVVAGGLLVLEALVMLGVALFVGLIGGLAGAMAVIFGSGGATDAKLAQGIAVIALTIVSPFVVAAVLGVGGVLLLLRKGRPVVIAAGFFAIAAQVAFHLLVEKEFHAAELVPCALHLLVIVVGFVGMPAPAATAAATSAR